MEELHIEVGLKGMVRKKKYGSYSIRMLDIPKRLIQRLIGLGFNTVVKVVESDVELFNALTPKDYALVQCKTNKFRIKKSKFEWTCSFCNHHISEARKITTALLFDKCPVCNHKDFTTTFNRSAFQIFLKDNVCH